MKEFDRALTLNSVQKTIPDIAFSWFGPFPIEGKLLSNFKLRRVRYAFGWVAPFLPISVPIVQLTR